MTGCNRRDFCKGLLAGAFGALLSWLGSLRAEKPQETPPPKSEEGRTYWVAAEGDDIAGDGTLAHPFASIGRALEVAHRTGPILPGDYIVMLPGDGEEYHDS